MGNKNKILYLILGIGIGMIVTNILHSFYPKLEYIELSDDTIIERARDLGMVNLKKGIKIEKEIVDNKDEGEVIKEVEKLKVEELEEEIVVESGSGLTTVAIKLYNAGLIDNKDEFIWFVKDEKLDKKIITGIYKIKHNSPYSEIIKILTDWSCGEH